MPACATTNFAACFNPLAEYGPGVLDVPHRVIIAPIWQLPFGKDRRWATSGIGATRWPAAGRCRRSSTCRAASRSASLQSDNTLFAGREPAEPHRRRFRNAGRLRRPARVGRSSNRDVDQPGGGHRRRRRAPSATRRGSITDVAHAADQEHRPVGVQEHRVERRQVGADQGRGHQPVQPRADQQHQRDMRATPRSGRSRQPVRVHAADAGDVPLHVLGRRRARSADVRCSVTDGRSTIDV